MQTNSPDERRMLADLHAIRLALESIDRSLMLLPTHLALVPKGGDDD
jgi:hypothetical protein